MVDMKKERQRGYQPKGLTVKEKVLLTISKVLEIIGFLSYSVIRLIRIIWIGKFWRW